VNFPAANRSRGVSFVVALLVLLGLSGAACSSDPVPLADEVTRQLDIPNESIAVIGVDDGELVRRIDLARSVAIAEELGTQLRIVVSGPEDQLVPAQGVVDRYGGTALTYKSDGGTFTTASRNMNGGQLDRARSAAEQADSIGGSALAFVQVLQGEGIQAGGTSLGRWLVLLLLAAAFLFVLTQLRAYLKARKRAKRRRADFASRSEVLRDWAQQLEPQVEEVQAQRSRLDRAGLTALKESSAFVAGVVETIDGATSIGELDAAEIRIARTAIKLRNLRQQISA